MTKIEAGSNVTTTIPFLGGMVFSIGQRKFNLIEPSHRRKQGCLNRACCATKTNQPPIALRWGFLLDNAQTTLMKPGVLPDEGDQMGNTEKREVRIGIGKLEIPMTIAQAKRYGQANMPGDLKMAGFETSIGVSDLEIHGGLWFRINYVKTMKTH